MEKIKELLRIVCIIILLPLLATIVFYDARLPYNSYWLGKLAIYLKLVEP
jgi:hypothetical protein